MYDSNRGIIVTFPVEGHNNGFHPSLDGSMLAFNGCTVNNQHCGIRIYERNGVLKKAISIARGVRYIRWASDSSEIWFALPPLLYSYRLADGRITMLRNDLPDVRDLVLVER